MNSKSQRKRHAGVAVTTIIALMIVFIFVGRNLWHAQEQNEGEVSDKTEIPAPANSTGALTRGPALTQSR